MYWAHVTVEGQLRELKNHGENDLGNFEYELAILANSIPQKTREYNLREGLDEFTDTLPKRFLAEPTREGAKLSDQDLEIMIAKYNEMRGKRDEKTSIDS